MKNYYFVAPSLPPLALGEVPEITFEELVARLKLSLSQEDWEKVVVLRLSIDLHNIRALYSKQPLDSRGNLSEKELDEALLVEDHLPSYVFEFLGQFEKNKEKVRHFFGLLSRYYAEEIPKRTGFLKQLLIFQRGMRLVLAAIRAKKAKRDILIELQFEDFTDPLAADILAQRDREEYEPPLEFQDLAQKIQSCGEDPWEQYRTVVLYEFEKIEEMTGYPLFSIDWILGYLVRLILVERWNELSEEKGKEIVDRYKIG